MRFKRTRGVACELLDGKYQFDWRSLSLSPNLQSAGVAVVVAINKIDRPEADVTSTKRALMEAGVNLEEFGGDVMCVPISALKGTNVNQLIAALTLQAELLDLRADPTGKVDGEERIAIVATM